MNTLDITQEEKQIIETLANLMRLDQDQLNLLSYVYKTIKFQGNAYKKDIYQIVSLGIPIYLTLSELRSVEIKEIVKEVNDNSIIYGDIKQSFIHLNSKMRIFYRNRDAKVN